MRIVQSESALDRCYVINVYNNGNANEVRLYSMNTGQLHSYKNEIVLDERKLSSVNKNNVFSNSGSPNTRCNFTDNQQWHEDLVLTVFQVTASEVENHCQRKST